LAFIGGHTGAVVRMAMAMAWWACRVTGMAIMAAMGMAITAAIAMVGPIAMGAGAAITMALTAAIATTTDTKPLPCPHSLTARLKSDCAAFCLCR
jgi:hypothetical protein